MALFIIFLQIYILIRYSFSSAQVFVSDPNPYLEKVGFGSLYFKEVESS